MAEGASSYYWERKDSGIPTSALGIKTNTLTLVSLIPPDKGQYRCVAVNEHGRNYSDYANLTINGMHVIFIYAYNINLPGPLWNLYMFCCVNSTPSNGNHHTNDSKW